MINRFRFLLSILACCLAGQAYGQDNPQTLADTIAQFKKTAAVVPGLNSDAIEYAPSISADGKVMVFETNKTGSYMLYESQYSNDGWGDPVSIEQINSYGDSTDLIGGPNVSFDNNTLYFFSSFDGGLGADDIYYSTREGETWSEPVNIGEPINTSGFEGFPSISADGKSLYFVRVNEQGAQSKELQKIMGSQTCYSIYLSNKKTDGTWSVPEKLPYPINQECEKAPRIMADSRTLIFSSNRLGGKGGYDLYQTKLDDAGDWNTPVPLDFVNSELSDQFPCISAQGDLMYYAYNSEDIWSVQIPPHLQQFKNNVIQGYARDGDTNEGIPVQIRVTDALNSDELMTIRNNPKDGRYSIVLAVGNSYNIEFASEGHTSFSMSYDLTKQQEYEEIERDISLFPSAKLNLNIYDIDIFEPISANVKVKVEGERAILLDTKSDLASGRLVLDLPLGKVYEVIVDKTNFESQYFVFDVSGLMIYRSFERDIEMTPKKKEVQINVADLTNNSKVRSRVRVRNRNRDEVIEVDGNQAVALRVGDRYEIEATSDQGYAFNSTVFDVSEDLDDIAIDQGIELKLQPLIVGANLTLKEILFETNSDLLTEVSFAELARVINLMRENPSLSVEVAAHTDDVGSGQYNRLLSERRAESVVEFLVESRVPNGRFEAKGYGENQPVYPNDSDDNRARNRRVVLKILAI